MPFGLTSNEKLPASPRNPAKPRRKLTQKLSKTFSIPIHTETAREHRSACSTLSLRTTEIRADFQQITPCTFRQLPATLITIAVRLIYTHDALPGNVKITIDFSGASPEKPVGRSTRWLDAIWKPQNPTAPELTDAFGPKDLIGDPEKVIDEVNANINVGGVPNSGIPGFNIGGKRMREKKFAWHVQGRSSVNTCGCASVVRTDSRQAYSWTIKANKLDSMETMPRMLNLWMVVVDGNKPGGPFRAEIAIEGQLKGLRGFFNKKMVVERRDFETRGRRGVLKLDEVRLAALLERGNNSRISDATDGEIKGCLVKN